MPLWYVNYTSFQSKTMVYNYPAVNCPMFGLVLGPLALFISFFITGFEQKGLKWKW